MIEAEKKPRKILIVDDDAVNNKLLTSRLTKRGFDVTSHDIGTGVVDMIELTGIELVLLDVMLPDISGVEVLKSIRAKYEKTVMPVIMVTSKDDPEDIAAALQLGANDYIAKPIHIDVAIARINTQLSVCDLYRDNMRRQQQDSMNALIVAFNHEINNPLAIAMGNLSLGMAKNDMVALKKSEAAMNRIAELIRKINQITKGKPVELTEYTKDTMMVKIS
jgi:DNA-binding response OmpR family regulator